MRRRRGDHRHGACAQPARKPLVVPPDAEHADDEQRDRHRHDPRALGELRVHDEQCDEPVAVAPTPFTSAFACQPDAARTNQYRTIPACESVNAVKTPIT